MVDGLVGLAFTLFLSCILPASLVLVIIAQATAYKMSERYYASFRLGSVVLETPKRISKTKGSG